MKKCFLITALIFVSTFCFAQETVFFPVNNSKITISIPDGWTYGIYYEDKMLEAVSEDETVIYSIQVLDTDDFVQAVFEIHREADTIFDEHDITQQPEEEIKGITFYKYYGFGLTQDYDYLQFNARLFQIDNGNIFMIFYHGFPEDIEYNEIDIFELNNYIEKQ